MRLALPQEPHKNLTVDLGIGARPAYLVERDPALNRVERDQSPPARYHGLPSALEVASVGDQRAPFEDLRKRCSLAWKPVQGVVMRFDFERFEALAKDGDIGPLVRDWYPEFAN
ncbi:MAG: hypothetical protein OXH07_07200 [Chloroflexi bacterium]|nr:hypothetical protein [Chloroflexota bacterium]